MIGCAFLFSAGYRRVSDAIPLSWLAGFHALRIVFGIFFIARYELGTIPAAFAFRGGYGDILAGLLGGLAALLIVFGVERRVVRWALIVFSVVGLLDFVVVFYTAATTFPPVQPDAPIDGFLMVPMFVVPQLVLTHVFVLRRLIKRAD